jgi:hypothetical protein
LRAAAAAAAAAGSDGDDDDNAMAMMACLPYRKRLLLILLLDVGFSREISQRRQLVVTLAFMFFPPITNAFSRLKQLLRAGAFWAQETKKLIEGEK